MLVYNTTPHTTTNYTSYDLVYGFPAVIPTSQSAHHKVTYKSENYPITQLPNMQIRLPDKKIISSKEKSKVQYDKNAQSGNFNIGDLVLLRNEARANK